MVSGRGSDKWVGVVLAGKYRFLEELGAGGMGQVFLAVDETIDRKVAIKVLHQELASDEAVRRRFETEAKAIARLHHPNCVMLYEFGFSEELDALYAVFEYVEGFSLESLVGERLSLGDILAVGTQVARAIGHAHKNQIIHRDLKPENIMVVGDAESMSIKVLDFGIARIAENDEKRTRLTQMGQMFGTPLYMSPEQARAKLDVTYSTDIYAIGVILYEMAEGRLPFMGETPIETVMMHIHDDVPQMERDNLPTDLEGIILTCLQKDADGRFDSCEALARALDSVTERGEEEESILTDKLLAVQQGEESDAEEKKRIETASTLLAHHSEAEDEGEEESPGQTSEDSDDEEMVTAPSMVDRSSEEEVEEPTPQEGWDDDLAVETMVPGMGGKKKMVIALLLVVLLGGVAGGLMWQGGEEEEIEPVAEVDDDQGLDVEAGVQQELEEPPEDPVALDDGADDEQDEGLDEATDAEEPTEEMEGSDLADDAAEPAAEEQAERIPEEPAPVQDEPAQDESPGSDEGEATEPEPEEEVDEEEQSDDEVDSGSPEGIQLPGDDDGSSGQPEGIGLPPQD